MTTIPIPSKPSRHVDDRTQTVLDKSGTESVEEFLKQKQEEFLRKGRVAAVPPRLSAADWRVGD